MDINNNASPVTSVPPSGSGSAPPPPPSYQETMGLVNQNAAAVVVARISPVQSPTVPHPPQGLNPFGDFDSETKKTLPKKTSERSFQDICLDEEGQEALELKKKDRGQKDERGKKKAEAKVMTGDGLEPIVVAPKHVDGKKICKKIDKHMKGFGRMKNFTIRPWRQKGILGIKVSQTYRVQGGKTEGEMEEKSTDFSDSEFWMKSEPRNCGCLLSVMTLGCCQQDQRINLVDNAEAPLLYFLIPASGPSRIEVHFAIDDELIGKVTKKGLTDFEVTDHEGNLMYQIRGPGLALKFGCGGKKKFFANIQGPNGQKVNIGKCQANGKVCRVLLGDHASKASVLTGSDYKPQQTKLLFFAAAFFIERLFYKHKFAKDDPDDDE